MQIVNIVYCIVFYNNVFRLMLLLEINFILSYLMYFFGGAAQWFMQDQNFACRRTCARPSRNLASMRDDGKCRVDAHEIHTCLYNMTIT